MLKMISHSNVDGVENAQMGKTPPITQPAQPTLFASILSPHSGHRPTLSRRSYPQCTQIRLFSRRSISATRRHWIASYLADHEHRNEDGAERDQHRREDQPKEVQEERDSIPE
jgi:hypothetical protein